MNVVSSTICNNFNDCTKRINLQIQTRNTKDEYYRIRFFAQGRKTGINHVEIDYSLE
jgi:hypothetical protein